MTHVVLLDGSPVGGGRTHGVLEALARATEAASATTEIRRLASETIPEVLAAIEGASAVVFGSPVYRASYASPVKLLLDNLPRGMWGETGAPLKGRAVAIVLTGASLHHFLALDALRNVLAGFFAAHVVPPGLYVPPDGFTGDRRLTPTYEALATMQGLALVELAEALRQSTTLKELVPQA
jgi:FMN reductase